MPNQTPNTPTPAEPEVEIQLLADVETFDDVISTVVDEFKEHDNAVRKHEWAYRVWLGRVVMEFEQLQEAAGEPKYGANRIGELSDALAAKDLKEVGKSQLRACKRVRQALESQAEANGIGLDEVIDRYTRVGASFSHLRVTFESKPEARQKAESLFATAAANSEQVPSVKEFKESIKAPTAEEMAAQPDAEGNPELQQPEQGEHRAAPTPVNPTPILKPIKAASEVLTKVGVALTAATGGVRAADKEGFDTERSMQNFLDAFQQFEADVEYVRQRVTEAEAVIDGYKRSNADQFGKT